jgi:peptidoglycan/LPS O-acetylase OafA/YrhL
MTARGSGADGERVHAGDRRLESALGSAPVYSHGGLIAYRPDIDGLRAVAVLPVVLYHVGVNRLHGGFVGVDVFFVISGFLITQLLSRDLDAGRYSIAQFYVRRARRIFPALFAMMAIVAAATLFLMVGQESLKFRDSMAAATLFASNLYFYATENYFSGGRTSLPLLHTWSLAVEEQFYIAFPLMLWLLRRHLSRIEKPILIGLAILSLAGAVWMVRREESAAFYLPHLRAWELLVGSLLALKVFGSPTRRWQSEALGLLGLAAIGLASVWFRDNKTLFPGESALLPVIGAGLVIYAGGRSGTLCTWGLSLAPVRFIGLISYSLYLWHWPIISLYAYHKGFNWELTPVEQALLVTASLVAAVISWRYIERPFRVHQQKPRTRPAIVLGSSAMVMCALLAISALVPMANSGLRPVDGDSERILAIMNEDHSEAFRSRNCFINRFKQTLADFDRNACLGIDPTKKNYLLIGDSHAAALWRGFSTVDPDINILQATVGACTPVRGSKIPGTCHDFLNFMFTEFIPQHHFDEIILTGRWWSGDIDDALQTAIWLKPYADRTVIFGPSVEYAQALPRALVWSRIAGDPGLVERDRLLKLERLDQDFEARARAAGVSYFSVYRTICPEGRCSVVDAEGLPIIFDADHVRSTGARLVALKARREGQF